MGFLLPALPAGPPSRCAALRSCRRRRGSSGRAWRARRESPAVPGSPHRSATVRRLKKIVKPGSNLCRTNIQGSRCLAYSRFIGDRVIEEGRINTENNTIVSTRDTDRIGILICIVRLRLRLQILPSSSKKHITMYPSVRRGYMQQEQVFNYLAASLQSWVHIRLLYTVA